MDKTANGGEGYDIHREIDHLLAGIEFERAQPVSSAQGVREFLSTVAGPGWLSARVLSYTVPGGAMVHMASLPGGLRTPGYAILMVAEALDGSLSMLQPTMENPPRTLGPLLFFSAALGNTPAQAQIYNELRECMKQIDRALRAVAKIVKLCETVKPRRKAYLLDQINHANQHLIEYVDGFRPPESK